MKIKNANILDIAGVAEYTTLSKSTIYKKINLNEIPYHKIGTRTLFFVEEIDNWVKNDGLIIEKFPELRIFKN